MATKLTLKQQQQIREEEGNPAGTYFAIIAMALLLLMVSMYFWIENGNQFLESPVLQSDTKLTPHDAY